VNKNTKIWLNYVAGGISLLLLYVIYGQVMRQLSGINADAWRHTGPDIFLWLCIGLMFINTTLEGYKWYLLANMAEPVPYRTAFASYLAGVAFSVITPNRIGEYPARVLYLGQKSVWRYVNVSVVGLLSQLSGVYLLGVAGLVYANVRFDEPLAKAGLAICAVATVLLLLIYRRFETWLPRLAQIKWLNRFAVYGRLLNNVSPGRQTLVLTISVMRSCIFTAQYLFLLRWMNVDVPMGDGFLMCALFFWLLAITPGLAFLEIGVRSYWAVYLFQKISVTQPNVVGIMAATAGIWLLNLVVPAVFGSVLIMRMRLLR